MTGPDPQARDYEGDPYGGARHEQRPAPGVVDAAREAVRVWRTPASRGMVFTEVIDRLAAALEHDDRPAPGLVEAAERTFVGEGFEIAAEALWQIRDERDALRQQVAGLVKAAREAQAHLLAYQAGESGLPFDAAGPRKALEALDAALKEHDA